MHDEREAEMSKDMYGDLQDNFICADYFIFSSELEVKTQCLVLV